MSSANSVGGGSYSSHGGAGDVSLSGSQRSGRRLRKSKRPDPLYNGQHRHRSPSPVSRNMIVQPDPFFTAHGAGGGTSVNSGASNSNNNKSNTYRDNKSVATSNRQQQLQQQRVRERSESPPMVPHSSQAQSQPQDQPAAMKGRQTNNNMTNNKDAARNLDNNDNEDDPVAAAKLELKRLQHEQQKTQQEVSYMAQNNNNHTAKPKASPSPSPSGSRNSSPTRTSSSSSSSRRQNFASRQPHGGNGSNSSGRGMVEESMSSMAYSDRSLNYADGKSIGGASEASASLAYSLESSNTFFKKMEENLEGRFVNLSKQHGNDQERNGSGGPSSGFHGSSGSAAASPARSNVYSVVHEEEEEEEEMAQYVSSASSSDDEYGPFGGGHFASASAQNENDLDGQVSVTASKMSMGMEDDGGLKDHLNDNHHDGATATTVSDPVTAVTTASTTASSTLDPTRSPRTALRSSMVPSSPAAPSTTGTIRKQQPLDHDRDRPTENNNLEEEEESAATSAAPASPANDAYADSSVSQATRLPNESLREFWERREREAAKSTETYRQSLNQSMDPDEAQRAQDKIKRFKSFNVPELTPSPLQHEQQGQEQAQPKQGGGATVTFEDEQQIQSSSAIAATSAAAAAPEAQAHGKETLKEFINQSSSTLDSLKASDTSMSILSEGGKLERVPSEDNSQLQHPTSLLNLLGGDSDDSSDEEEEEEHNLNANDDPDDDDDREHEFETSATNDAAIVSAAAAEKPAHQEAFTASEDGVEETATEHNDYSPSHPHDQRNAHEVESNGYPRHLAGTAQGDEAAGVVRESKALGSGSMAHMEAPKSETALVAVGDQDADHAPQGETNRSNSTGWSSSRSVPNLHRDLAICAWSRLDRHLVKLSKYPKVMLQALAQQNPDLGNATPLHTACWKAPPPLALHMISLLTRIYKHMERVCLATDLDGNTPLHLSAANSCHSDPAEHHGDYDVFSGKDEIYGTAIDAKSIPGFKESDVIEALVLSAPKALTIQNEEGDTPLHLAVSSSSSMERVVTCLIDKPEADACLLQDCSGATPLHAAIGNQVSLQVLEIIFRPAPEASRMVDNHGLLPLHYVAAFCHTPIVFVKQLLKAHPGAISTRTADGGTPLHLAISNAKEEEDDEGNAEQANDPNGDDAGDKGDDHKTLTIETIKLLLGNYPSVDPRNPVFIKNQAELTPLRCCAEFDSPDSIKHVIVMHCVNHTPWKNAKERRACAESFADTAGYKLPPNFDSEFDKKDETNSAKAPSAQAKTTAGQEGDPDTPLTFGGSMVPAAAMAQLHTQKSERSGDQFDSTLSVSEDSICFSEFLDDEPSTAEPARTTEHESIRPQLDKLEAQLMTVARRQPSPAPTRKKLTEMTPQAASAVGAMDNSPREDRYSNAMPSQEAVGDKARLDAKQKQEDDANFDSLHSYRDEDNEDQADDDSARSSVSSITCTIFLKSAQATGRTGRLGGGGLPGLSSFYERPQSTADKMEALARVMPYAADASRGTHKMPLSLAHNSQVKEMAAMLSLPMFCKKKNPPGQGVSSKSTRSRRSLGSANQRPPANQLRGIQER